MKKGRIHSAASKYLWTSIDRHKKFSTFCYSLGAFWDSIGGKISSSIDYKGGTAISWRLGTLANISRRNGGMLYLRTLSDQRTESQCISKNTFLTKHNLKLICMEEEVALMPLKDGSPMRARLVDRGCHNFISKKTGRVLKATEDQRI